MSQSRVLEQVSGLLAPKAGCIGLSTTQKKCEHSVGVPRQYCGQLGAAKSQIALAHVREAIGAVVPAGIVQADAGYESGG
jgi:SRSO17 transposase